MNICMVGYGMMGTWHSEALRRSDHTLYLAVGPRAEPLRQFAEHYQYAHWTTDFGTALADHDVDVVVLANPSEVHADTALTSIASGKPTFVEIPIAMSLADAERVVSAADTAGVALGVCHPMRMRPEMIALRGRIEAGTERVHQVSGRFVIHRLENIGATGYHRSWTDNVLWHQLAHFVDFGAWMLGGTPRRVQSLMSPSDPRTGIPMDCTILVEMADGASMLTTGSFLGRERISETFVITDADSYRIDVPRAVMITGRETRPIAVEQQNCALAIRDFLDAVAHKRTPLITGASVLPAMRILQTVQDQWDERYGRQSLPGRPLSA